MLAVIAAIIPAGPPPITTTFIKNPFFSPKKGRPYWAIAFINPNFPYSYVNAPCWNPTNGALSGPSQDNSIEEPCVKLPDAIIIWSWYPGVSHGSGKESESTGEPACIPWQYFINFSLSPNSIV